MIPVFGAAVYFSVRDRIWRSTFLAAAREASKMGRTRWARRIQALLWKARWLFLVFGLVDLRPPEARVTSRTCKMSKQEIRDEFKEVEGNPLMKLRIRRIQRDLARRRMMHEVPTATAVIVNPTHYAVALKYQLDWTTARQGGGQGQELSGAADPAEGARKPGSADRKSAAGAGALQVGGRGAGDSGAFL